jgi:hypothetical protein
VRFVAIVGVLLTGCFYLDPIVATPTVVLRVLEPEVGAPVRGGKIKIMAQYTQDHREGTYVWKAYACPIRVLSQSDAIGCSTTPFALSDKAIWDFTIPKFVDNGSTPLLGMLIQVEARDARGVLAQGGVEAFPVADQAPTLDLRKASHSFTVGAPIQLFAKFGDPDDPLADVGLEWKVFTPSNQPGYTLDDFAVEPDGNDVTHITAGKRFVAQGSGTWTVRVTARDRLGEKIERDVEIVVARDRAPCLAQLQPIVPPAGVALPVTASTVFQVAVVDDDLDAQPPLIGDPAFGATRFAWSILRPGASVREPLAGATGSSIDFDPEAFTPGDIVELRVEIFDRNQFAIPCVDDAPTCSVISQAACLQRQTWRLEIR